MTELQLQGVYIYKIYHTYSIITTNNGFVTIDDGFQNATHCCAFYIKDDKLLNFDSFGGFLDKFSAKSIT